MSVRWYIIRKLGSAGRVAIGLGSLWSELMNQSRAEFHEAALWFWSSSSGCSSTCTSISLSLQDLHQIRRSIEGEARWESYSLSLPLFPLSILNFSQVDSLRAIKHANWMIQSPFFIEVKFLHMPFSYKISFSIIWSCN